MGIVVPLNTRRPSAALQAVSGDDALAHPLLASFAAKLPPDVAGAINQVVANGIVSGTTTAVMARQIAALGFDRRATKGIARTGAAALADDAGCETLADVAAMTEKNVRRLANVGAGSVAEIKSVLSANGLAFAGTLVQQEAEWRSRAWRISPAEVTAGPSPRP